MKRISIAVLLLSAIGFSTGCNNQQAQPTAVQQQEVASSLTANQSSAVTAPAPVPVTFKTDPKNLLQVFTPEDLSRSLDQRHGLDKLRGETIRLKARLQDTPPW
jgi:hypothetical protein